MSKGAILHRVLSGLKVMGGGETREMCPLLSEQRKAYGWT